MEGRLLTANSLVAFKASHYIKRRTQGNSRITGLKSDVSKSYDLLEWSFIEGMLIKYDFHKLWISRVVTCVKSVIYSFI